jgi:hypothetical protein
MNGMRQNSTGFFCNLAGVLFQQVFIQGAAAGGRLTYMAFALLL